MAKVLLLDIETAPHLGWVWGKYDQNVIKFKQHGFILSVAYQWLGEKDIHVKALPDYRGYDKNPTNDLPLIKEIKKLLDEADVVVAHNGDNFDLKKINARIVYYRLGSPSPYLTYDTLKISKKHFRFESNSLNDVCDHLGLGHKLPHLGFKMWEDCMDRDPIAWDNMKKYNVHDVFLLGELYPLLREWGRHPNLAMIDNKVGACPSCASDRIQKRGLMHLKTRSYQRLNCQECGTWFRGDYVKK
jgi:DNA polymerase elongation subunit (family B)